MTFRRVLELAVLTALLLGAVAWGLRDLVWLWQQGLSFEVNW